jgi:hypothetical protein
MMAVKKERRGQKRTNIKQIETAMKVKSGALPDRRKSKSEKTDHAAVKQSVRDTWLFSNSDGTSNKFGDALVHALAKVNNDTDTYTSPDFEDVFAIFWDQLEMELPERERLVTTKLKDGTKKSVMKKFTRNDWRRRALTHVKKTIEKGLKGKLSARVEGLLKVGRKSASQSQLGLLESLTDIYEKGTKRQTEMFDG